MWKITFVLLLTIFAGAFARQYTNPLHPRPVGVKNPTPLIVGGVEAKPGQFPFLVSIQRLAGPYRAHKCGGSILNEYWILTAAHCVVVQRDFESNNVVVAGVHDLSIDEGTEQIIRIERLVKHPLYPDVNVVAAHDIALIKLSKALEFNTRVEPIVLPEPGSIPTGNSTISGWGSMSSGQNAIMPDFLQMSVLPILEFSVCLKLYFDSPLQDTNFCTGPLTGGNSICLGDSGGPLVQNRVDGTKEVIGVVSWGTDPCGSVNAPSVFTRVSAYIDFIKNSIKS